MLSIRVDSTFHVCAGVIFACIKPSKTGNILILFYFFCLIMNVKGCWTELIMTNHTFFLGSPLHPHLGSCHHCVPVQSQLKNSMTVQRIHTFVSSLKDVTFILVKSAVKSDA